jgi:2',3'-cyclic-nucleotide 2'-phosphodiesterase (5'-nucleotidase family)
MKCYYKFFIIFFSIFVLNCSIRYVNNCDRYKWVRIVYTSDINGHIFSEKQKKISYGGLNLLSSAINKFKMDSLKKSNPFFLFDGGDLFNAFVYSDQNKMSLLNNYINYNNYDLLSIGNHELDYGEFFFKNFNKINSEFVCSNLVSDDTEVPDFFNKVKPYKIIEKDNVKIGILGYITENLKDILPIQYRNLQCDNINLNVLSYKILRSYVNTLRSNGADIIILLSHNGFDINYPEQSPDYKIAEKVKGIDIIISSHREMGMMDPYVHPKTGTYICANYGGGKTIGKIDLMVDLIYGKIKRFYHILKPVNSNNFNVSTAFEKRKLNEKFFVYDKHKSQIAVNLLFDALKAKFNSDAVIINRGYIRKNITTKNISFSLIDEVYPFQNFVVELIIPKKFYNNFLDVINNENEFLVKADYFEKNSYKIITSDYCFEKFKKVILNYNYFDRKIFDENVSVKKVILKDVIKKYLTGCDWN